MGRLTPTSTALRPGSPRAAVLAVLAVCALAPGACRRREPTSGSKPVESPVQPVRVVHPAAPGSFVRLVAKVRASVVHLSTTAPVQGGPAEWFPSGEADEGARRSLGTGIVIEADGTILTNDHLVGKDRDLFVRAPGRTPVRATVIGRDENADLAVLKAELPAGVRLVPLRLGDSDRAEVGEWVLAVGNPFGLGPSVSVGVLSAKEIGDALPGKLALSGYLQTDAAIHAGNSGGPLLNTAGEVIGICTAVEPRIDGVGFALPSSLVKKILPALRRDGRLARVFVGIYTDRVTEERAKAAGLKEARGSLVTQVVPGGPADRAGLRAGDIVTSFGGKEVREWSELPWLASLAGVSKDLPVTVQRAGQSLRFTLRTESMPE